MNCPVCNYKKNTLLLKLNNFPIYQHPMDDTSNIPLPHVIDIEYSICRQCAHAFQLNYNKDILEAIYKHHYYTPSPENIGASFRYDFIKFISENNIIDKKTLNVLEIGCSSGEVLAELKTIYSNVDYHGIEPNEETAIAAEKKELIVEKAFFTEKIASSLCFKSDLIYSRHVIEHIFDFKDFFKAISKVSHSTSTLILETPSLDWSITQPSTQAFHVEHIHVFSERSLVTLANQFGWFKDKSIITSSGNLIISFTKKNIKRPLSVAPLNTEALQKYNNKIINNLQKVCKSGKFIFWGAGSSVMTLIALTKLRPEYIIDGNPNKVGKRFCGLNYNIHCALELTRELISMHRDTDYTMIISSSFYIEIEKELKRLGWRGIIYSPYACKSNTEQ